MPSVLALGAGLITQEETPPGLENRLESSIQTFILKVQPVFCFCLFCVLLMAAATLRRTATIVVVM